MDLTVQGGQSPASYMESAADWPPLIIRVPRKPKVAQFCAAPWPNFTPPLTHGVPGAGVFAVNAAGRMRWGAFPNIISDDTFVRLSFTPDERIGVDASYTWPLVEGWKNLVRVRRRQNAGVNEIQEKYPDLLRNDDKPPFPIREKISLALKDPIGFAVYSGVALAVRLTGASASGWSRGR